MLEHPWNVHESVEPPKIRATFPFWKKWLLDVLWSVFECTSSRQRRRPTVQMKKWTDGQINTFPLVSTGPRNIWKGLGNKLRIPDCRLSKEIWDLPRVLQRSPRIQSFNKLETACFGCSLRPVPVSFQNRNGTFCRAVHWVCSLWLS